MMELITEKELLVYSSPPRLTPTSLPRTNRFALSSTSSTPFPTFATLLFSPPSPASSSFSSCYTSPAPPARTSSRLPSCSWWCWMLTNSSWKLVCCV